MKKLLIVLFFFVYSLSFAQTKDIYWTSSSSTYKVSYHYSGDEPNISFHTTKQSNDLFNKKRIVLDTVNFTLSDIVVIYNLLEIHAYRVRDTTESLVATLEENILISTFTNSGLTLVANSENSVIFLQEKDIVYFKEILSALPVWANLK